MSINNKRSYTEYTVTTATTDFVIGFDDYDDITKDTIVVTVNGVLAESQGYAVMRKNAQVISITPAVQSGTVRLERVTDIDESFHQFTAGALFSAKSVDENFEQVRHSQQEVRDGFEFLEFNTNGVISDAKAATDRANAAAELAENTDVTQLQIDLNLQKFDTGITATAKFGGVERTQAEKNSDVVDAKDFGILPDILDDQTSKFDLFLHYLRSSKKEGTISAGTYVVSPNKTRTFGSEVVNYCLDISGVSLRGAVGGYRNTSGTILVQNTDSQAAIETTVMMLQAQQNLPNIQCRISGFAARNTGVVLRLTYSVHSEISHLYWDKTCVNGIILGEFTLASGALFNKFRDINGECLDKPLQLRGKYWCNANIFENFYLTGAGSSSIEVLSGYGAIANTFIGGEFASKSDSGAAGLILNNVSATTFYSTYFESQAESIVIDGMCRKLHLNNVTIGTTKASATNANSLIYHKSGGASVVVTGGSVYLNTVGLQDNMRFIRSNNPTALDLEITALPYVLKGTTLGWKLIELEEALTYRSLFVPKYTESTGVSFSTTGAKIANLVSTSKVTYTLVGGSVNVFVELNLDDSSVLTAGNYYVRLLCTPKNNAIGNATFSSPRGLEAGRCTVSPDNKNIFISIFSVTSAYASGTGNVLSSLYAKPISNSELSGFDSVGSRIQAEISVL